MKRILLALILSLLIVTPVHAQEDTYTVEYDFNFFIQPNTTDLNVDLDITLTNIRSDVYINEYAMKFPRNFFFKNLRVTGADGSVPYIVSEKDNAKNITFRFPEPEGGAYSQNRLKLTYTLANMHTPKGRINEVILPLLVSDENALINATLNLPDGFDRQISISKPIPTEVTFQKIIWRDIDAHTILALFGESQIYDTQLSYSLVNTGLTSEVQTIALPPETLYQKVFIQTLEPQPLRTYTDDDGNFLAEYSVPARKKVDIAFKGFVEVFVKPQSSLRDHIRASFVHQQSYLLTEEQQWKLGKTMSTLPLDQLSTPETIYNFTVDTLSYSLDRLEKDSSRYGAEKALSKPNQAVCMEYTDLFIALAREKGIPSREIQGYGYSESQKIRPQSLVLDELHAWPEYYDIHQEIWLQVDPTWEDTSGIDYFNGFDVNHIALAVHGKNPLEPLPAGFYKTARTKDVNIQISSLRPSASVSLSVDHTLNDAIVVGKSYDSTITITNTGKAFVHDVNVIPESRSITVTSGPIHVNYLAPYESREIPIQYSVEENFSPSDTLSFVYEGSVLGAHDIRIISKKNSGLQTMVAIAGGAVILLSIYIFRKRKTG